MARTSGEFTRIARFLRPFGTSPHAKAGVTLGPGDDCAILKPRAGHEICVTTDSLVEGVHFSRPAFSFEDIGHKALAVNLSDLAAMGARPTWFVCALQVPEGVTDKDLDGLARGMAKLARQSGIALVGGNFSAGRELAVTLTVAGEVRTGKALRRSGGRPGDVLFVSGQLGGARLGLEQLQKDARARSEAVTRQKRPEPRLALGMLAADYASACIDLSDGLAQDLQHLCRASKVGARVDAEALPLSPSVAKSKSKSRSTEAHAFALAGGEDYELLLAVPPKRADAFARACAKAGYEVRPIGQLTSGRALRFAGLPQQAARQLRGFDHFQKGPAN